MHPSRNMMHKDNEIKLKCAMQMNPERWERKNK